VVLVDGPSGWGEFAPFLEYRPAEAARWLAAAVEAAWGSWPAPVRQLVPVNAIVPAVGPDEAGELVRGSGGCRTAKVKVAEPGQRLDEDVARVAAVRAALDEGGPGGLVRVDANGAWRPRQAAHALRELAAVAGGLELAEQPCATVPELAELRRSTDVPIAADEGVRRSADPEQVAGLRDAVDVVVVKVAPLGGVRAALRVADAYGLPTVVSSALDTSVGLAAGAALAAALPELTHACGLGSGALLAADVVPDSQRVLPRAGAVRVSRPEPDRDRLAQLAAPAERADWWRSRLAEAYEIMVGR
jgi:o-succinylbenzoate synthase